MALSISNPRGYGELHKQWRWEPSSVSHQEEIEHENRFYGPRFSVDSSSSPKTLSYVSSESARVKFGALHYEAEKKYPRLKSFTIEEESFLERMVRGGYLGFSLQQNAMMSGISHANDVLLDQVMMIFSPSGDSAKATAKKKIMRGNIMANQSKAPQMGPSGRKTEQGDHNAALENAKTIHLRVDYPSLFGIGVQWEYSPKEDTSSSPKGDDALHPLPAIKPDEDDSQKDKSSGRLSYLDVKEFHADGSYEKEGQKNYPCAYPAAGRDESPDDGIFKLKKREIRHFHHILEEIAATYRMFIKNPSAFGGYRNHFSRE